jgi:hypothetical protein
VNIIQLASEVLGIAADTQVNIEYLNYVAWEHTGYPSFYHGDPETYFRKQLEEYKAKFIDMRHKDDLELPNS